MKKTKGKPTNQV